MSMSSSDDGPRATETEVGHCKADETDVYVGRGQNGRHMMSVDNPGKRGWLGNPHRVDDWGRERSIERFRETFVEKLRRDKEFAAAVADLSGKTLGCWCQRLEDDEPACHGEVIAEHADRLARERFDPEELYPETSIVAWFFESRPTPLHSPDTWVPMASISHPEKVVGDREGVDYRGATPLVEYDGDSLDRYVCPSCHERLLLTWVYCPHCGYQTTSEDDEGDAAPSPATMDELVTESPYCSTSPEGDVSCAWCGAYRELVGPIGEQGQKIENGDMVCRPCAKQAGVREVDDGE